MCVSAAIVHLVSLVSTARWAVSLLCLADRYIHLDVLQRL